MASVWTKKQANYGRCLKVWNGYLYSSSTAGTTDLVRTNNTDLTAAWATVDTNTGIVNGIEEMGSYLYQFITGDNEVKRSSNGTAWSSVDTIPLPFSFPRVFQNRMYVGVEDTVGGNLLWRSDTNGENWAAVSEVFTGTGGTRYLYELVEFRDDFYAIVGGTSGSGQVWKSSDGVSWSVVFTLPSTTRATNLYQFDTHLITVGHHASGARIYSSIDGSEWNKIYTFTSNEQNSLEMYASGTHLYIATGYPNNCFRTEDWVTMEPTDEADVIDNTGSSLWSFATWDSKILLGGYGPSGLYEGPAYVEPDEPVWPSPGGGNVVAILGEQWSF